jgi:large subunit ribosomal protein L31e
MAKEEEYSDILYTIPLKELKLSRRSKRSSQAIKQIKRFIARHIKAEESDIWIDPRINELVWKRGIQKPPGSIRVKISMLEEEGKIGVELPKELEESDIEES